MITKLNIHPRIVVILSAPSSAINLDLAAVSSLQIGSLLCCDLAAHCMVRGVACVSL